MAMTKRQMIVAAGKKQKTETVPFGARIDVWYNYHFGHGTLPEKYRGKNMVEICRDP